MEPVQYKGYTIVIKHYAAFRHCRREYPEIFDYIIFKEKERVREGYGLATLGEAVTEAKRGIDTAGSHQWRE